MKVAFATSDHHGINAHFGWAKEIDVYEIDPDGYTFLETINFTGDLKEDGNEDKLLPKVQALLDCTIVYVSAIGGSAAARLIQKGITPIKSRTEADTIKDTLDRLVQSLKGSPPPWLRKALQQRKPAFDDLETEEELTI